MAMLTEKDKKRIEEAFDLNPIEWGKAWQWSLEADTEEAKDMLNSISNSLYHKEEASMGMC